MIRKLKRCDEERRPRDKKHRRFVQNQRSYGETSLAGHPESYNTVFWTPCGTG